MKVICKNRRRSDIKVNPSCRHQMQEVAYELVVEQAYTVYGMILAGACLKYLIDPKNRMGLSLPTWYPAELFTVQTTRLPSSWLFAYDYDREVFQNPISARWGYAELVTSDEHLSGLSERNERDMMIWLRRKAEIDADESELNQGD